MYSICSFNHFPCNSAREWFLLRRDNLKITQIIYIPISVDLSFAEYYINTTAILIFLN